MASRTPTTGRPGLSLEHRLPLLITALLAVTMAAGVAFAYAEVKQTAVESARGRLELVSQQLAGILERSLPRRVALLQEVAADPAILAIFAAPDEADRAAAADVLERVHSPGQPELPIVLRALDRRPLLQVGELPGELGPPDAAERGPFPDSTGIGPFFQVGPRSFFWAVAPVQRAGRTAGYLAELRPVGGESTAQQVEGLIGGDISVFFANTAGGAWIALDGTTAPAPGWPFSGAREYQGEGGGERFVHATAVAGTPFSIVAEVPLLTVLQRPSLFLRRGGLAVLLLILAGGAAAWILSRGVTQPVKELRLASEAIARGEYDRRIHLQRSDELGILADTFNGMAARVQATHEELTHHYEAAQQLAGELERASQAKSGFLATMSHEIRTPINAIIGYTDLLHLGLSGPVSEEQQRQLERIRTSGRHLISLVDQVLDYARVESDTLRVEHRTASVMESIEMALTVVTPQAASEHVELAAHYEDEVELRYVGDPQRVDQILVNLLSNAIKFSRPGGRTSVRCFSCEGRLPGEERSGRWTCFVVEDTGVGIPAEQLESIFEPFVQLETGYTRRFGGTGLGLAISRRLARSMGGDLSVESEPGVGSRFTLWLPAAGSGAPGERTASAGAGAPCGG